MYWCICYGAMGLSINEFECSGCSWGLFINFIISDLF